ncbi:MAG: HAD hydrolase-like protein [Spirochaetota bacterium]
MKNYKYILLDLDGTLTDPADGITNSIKYALNKYKIAAKREELLKFIGPPLRDSFMKYYGFNREKAEEAVAYYREYFALTGIYENSIYPGVPEMLFRLKKSEKTLLLATSKPTVYANKVLEYFNIHEYFNMVSGSNLDGTMGTKSEVVEYALSFLPDSGLELAVMAGDREYDITGAVENKIDSIGVTWGFGTVDELVSAGATYIAKTVKELEDLLIP